MNWKIKILAFFLLEIGCVSNTKQENKVNGSNKGEDTSSSEKGSVLQTQANPLNNFSNSDVEYKSLKIVLKDDLPTAKLSLEYFDRAIDACKKNNYLIAFNDLTLAIRTTPDYAGAYCARAIVKTQLGEDTSGVMNDFNKAIQLKPNYAYLYHYRAFYKWNYVKDSLGALKDQNCAIKVEPNNVSARDQRFMMRREIHDYKGAIEDINVIIHLKPKWSVYYRYKGTEELYMKAYYNATDDYSKAIKLNIQDTGAYYGRGLAESYNKDYEKAILDFSRVIELDASQGIAFFYRGENELALKEKDKGCEDLYKAKSMGIEQANTDIIQANCSSNVIP